MWQSCGSSDELCLLIKLQDHLAVKYSSLETPFQGHKEYECSIFFLFMNSTNKTKIVPFLFQILP